MTQPRPRTATFNLIHGTPRRQQWCHVCWTASGWELDVYALMLASDKPPTIVGTVRGCFTCQERGDG
jgi:hypothetical protein